MSDDWQPLPGMFKLRCAQCRRSFASASRFLAVCPNCLRGRGPQDHTPFETPQDALNEGKPRTRKRP